MSYLDQLGLLAPNADLGDLPVEVVRPGAAWRVRFPEGVATLGIGSENGKVSLTNAPPETLAGLFTRWTGSPAEGQRLAEAVVDWRDPDALKADAGPEATDYAGTETGPRNRAFGVGDAHLVAGLGPEDFRPTLDTNNDWLLPEGIYSLVTVLGSDGRVNPNDAPVPVLEALPGIDTATATRMVEMREERPFADLVDLEQRTGILPGTDAWNALTLGRSTITWTVVAENASGMRQVRRRVRQVANVYDPTANRMEARLLLRQDTRFDSEVRSTTTR
jgi:type II secretory pathway component PulK